MSPGPRCAGLEIHESKQMKFKIIAVWMPFLGSIHCLNIRLIPANSKDLNVIMLHHWWQRLSAQDWGGMKIRYMWFSEDCGPDSPANGSCCIVSCLYHLPSIICFLFPFHVLMFLILRNHKGADIYLQFNVSSIRLNCIQSAVSQNRQHNCTYAAKQRSGRWKYYSKEVLLFPLWFCVRENTELFDISISLRVVLSSGCWLISVL